MGWWEPRPLSFLMPSWSKQSGGCGACRWLPVESAGRHLLGSICLAGEEGGEVQCRQAGAGLSMASSLGPKTRPPAWGA